VSKTATALCLVSIAALSACKPEAGDPAPEAGESGPAPAGGEPTPFDFEHVPMGVIAKVKVDETARIFIDGRQVTMDQLEAALAALPPKRSAVWYHRSNPLQEAPPDVAAVSRQVVAAIARAKLPLSLVQEDFD